MRRIGQLSNYLNMKPTIASLCKKIIFLLMTVVLASCISVHPEPQVTARPNFVTATLAPTKTGSTTATLFPSPEVSSEKTATSTIKTTPPSDCKDNAVLLRDVTIQDDTQVKPGEKFIKTWEFQNTGTCPWINYTVKFSEGDKINAPLSIPMPTARPKEKVQVSMELTAPTADGRYAGYFSLLNSNGEIVPIGTEKTFWVKFRVGAYAIIPTASGANPPQPGNGAAGNCNRGQNAGYVDQIVSLINSARADAGLQALTVDPQIAAFAQSHAEDMAFNNFLSHDGSDGTFGERMMHYDTTHSGSGIFGEILAIGTPQNAMDQWRKDEHWNFVLTSNTLIGAGYAYNSCSDFGGYFTVDFGG
jgi:uncharacterized protein YkwD